MAQKEINYYPYYGSRKARFDTKEDIEHFLRMVDHSFSHKNLVDHSPNLFGMTNSAYYKYLESGQYKADFSSSEGWAIDYGDKENLDKSIYLILAKQTLIGNKKKEDNNSQKCFSKESDLADFVIKNGFNSLKEKIKKQMTLSFVQKNLTNIIQKLSTSNVKYHGQHIDSKNASLNIKPLIAKKIEESDSSYINSNIVNDDLNSLTGVNASQTKLIKLLTLNMRESSSNKSKPLMQIILDRNMSDIFDSDIAFNCFKDQVTAIPDEQIPEAVVPGMKNIIIPDGQGGYISLTPSPNPDVMLAFIREIKQSFNNNYNNDIYYLKRQNIYINRNLDDNEKKNSLGSHQGLMTAYNQMPGFSHKSYKDRKQYIIQSKVLNGTYDINPYMFKSKKIKSFINFTKNIYTYLQMDNPVLSKIMLRKMSERSYNIGKWIVENIILDTNIDKKNIPVNTHSFLLNALKNQNKKEFENLILNFSNHISQLISKEINVFIPLDLEMIIRKEFCNVINDMFNAGELK